MFNKLALFNKQNVQNTCSKVHQTLHLHHKVNKKQNKQDGQYGKS